ncbi:Phage-related protein [Lactobacillus equicursoris DSM 19284 = JCM 14600 = CIP 110162]|nr:hypothetical protein [Lactobacillus equicursoris]CCK86371.1 Phage-related protein [Lactobacillus equicursoris DSM 19284 = JCM 14600 = CIP 110162]
MMDNNNVLQMPSAVSQDAGTLSENVSISKTRYNNGDGGGTMKDDRYVTHAELELNTEKVLHHMDNKFGKVDAKLVGLDKRLTNVDERLASIDKHLTNVDKQFVETEQHLSKVDNRLDLLGQKIDQIPTTIENSILREREFQRQQHTETIRYIFGTIVIGLISIAVAIISLML